MNEYYKYIFNISSKTLTKKQKNFNMLYNLMIIKKIKFKEKKGKIKEDKKTATKGGFLRFVGFKCRVER